MYFREEEEDPSSDDNEPELSAFLLIGRSKSGKSSLLRSLLKPFQKQYNKKVFLLNDRSRRKNRQNNYTAIEWSEIGKISDCILVVEDIVRASKVQIDLLSETLNHGCHHRRINPLVCVSHSLTGQGIWALVKFFTRVYISAVPGNLESLDYILNKHGFTKEQRTFHAQNLVNNKQPYAHFLYDIDNRSIKKVQYQLEPPDSLEEDEEGGTKKRKRMTLSARDQMAQAKAQRYLSVLRNPTQALACFDLLYAKLDKKSVSPQTLDVSLHQKGDRQPVTVSLISYLACLTDPKVPASREVWKFHKYCVTLRGIRLPDCYILNEAFRSPL